jgi:ABC-type transporter Mla MlaB component
MTLLLLALAAIRSSMNAAHAAALDWRCAHVYRVDSVGL